jgi:hypothetical protein
MKIHFSNTTVQCATYAAVGSRLSNSFFFTLTMVPCSTDNFDRLKVSRYKKEKISPEVQYVCIGHYTVILKYQKLFQDVGA